MNTSNDKARHRVPRWVAPCVCLLLLGSSRANPEPVRQAPPVRIAAIAEPPPIAAPEPTPPLAPTTAHAVLVRGRDRLELDLPLDGQLSKDDADAVAKLMRDPFSGRMRRIATGTLVLLADLAARFPDHDIEIVSAVRAEPERTRDGVKHSKHWDGHAIDLRVVGVKLAEVRDAMWANHHDIGVGWYPAEEFIHIDYRPDVHDTAWTQPKYNADYIYNPHWSRAARDPDMQPAAKPSHNNS
ncbi:MAG: DUF882 domain-containing protein [Deltaproteobacteria bacterium]|nr:DUF882 domain-containing protein [Deltaproteobacteria bacterium]